MKVKFIPKGCFAADTNAAAKKRKELRDALLGNGRITIESTGNVNTSKPGQATKPHMVVPEGIFATDDAAAKKRKELREALLGSKNITVAPDGNVTKGTNGGNCITIPKGKLALQQWYEKDKDLLEAEKASMSKFFPYFKLEILEDKRLAWVGSLNIGVIGDNKWYVMAVYDNDHGQRSSSEIGMGGTIKVYLIDPDIDDLIAKLDWRPHHLLIDSYNQKYLCTTEAQYVKTGTQVTTAASTLGWAVKWLLCFELVLTGDLSTEEFDRAHFI